MKKINFKLLLGCLLGLMITFNSGASYAEETYQCLDNITDNAQAKACFERTYIQIEGKRIALEKRAMIEMPDVTALNSALRWNDEYQEAALDARDFFEQYRLAECTRKQLLMLDRALTGHERDVCMIRLTKDRVDALMQTMK